MRSYCLKYNKSTENINPRISKGSNVKTILLSKRIIYNTKKSKLFKTHEGSEILNTHTVLLNGVADQR